MRGPIIASIVTTGFLALLCPLFFGESVAQQSSSGSNSSGNKNATIIHIATSASSPADAKRIATGFAMARHSAKAGRKTIVYLNGGAAKLATSGLSLADEISSELQLDKYFSGEKQDGVQIYVATTDVAGGERDTSNLRSGVKPLSAADLFKKITPETVVLSF